MPQADYPVTGYPAAQFECSRCLQIDVKIRIYMMHILKDVETQPWKGSDIDYRDRSQK